MLYGLVFSSNFRCRSMLMISMAKWYITLELKLSSSNGIANFQKLENGHCWSNKESMIVS